MAELKTGALSRAEIQSVWEGSVDKGYRDPLVRAGEGRGFEAWTQLFAQFERASKAIDVTTQAMFISPWSGQTNPPAAGGQKATVTLAITRSKRLLEPLFLQKGLFVVEEQTTDFGPGAGVVVNTGRRYLLAEDLYFAPGEQGPFDAVFEAERFGYGYNNPLPGTIKAIEQKGTLFENDRATVEVTDSVADLAGALSKTRGVGWNEPDMFVPDHLGQYVLYTAGANAGQVGRMTSFDPPVPPLVGSSMELEMIYVIGINPFTYFGPFLVGEIITVTNGPTETYGKIIDVRMVAGVERVTFVLLNGPVANIIPGSVLSSPTANGNIQSIDFKTEFVAEAPVVGIGGATWRILDWVLDWGLEARNELSPANGKAAFLDELGFERAIGRSPGETDEFYRARVREIADVVTPNAIRRALNRALPGTPWSFREVGLPLFPGFFYDGTNEAHSPIPHGASLDCYDVDTYQVHGFFVNGAFDFQEPIVLEDPSDFTLYGEGWMGRETNVLGVITLTIIRKTGWPPLSGATYPRVRGLHTGTTMEVSSATTNDQANLRRYRVWLNYTEFRGFFLVTMPALAYGEFGFPYDTPTYQNNGYDIPSPWMTAYDGFPRLAADTYRRVWDAVEAARAGGVGWELRLDEPSRPGATYFYSPPVPVASSLSLMNYSQGDPLGGGQQIILIGNTLIDVFDVDFGGVSTSFVVDSNNQITADLPPHAPGNVLVTVTGPGGTSNTLAFEYWSPAQFGTAPSVLLRAQGNTGYTEAAGNGTFLDASGNARHASHATLAPPAGAAVLGNEPPDFNGVFGGNRLTHPYPIGTLFGAAKNRYFAWGLVKKFSGLATNASTSFTGNAFFNEAAGFGVMGLADVGAGLLTAYGYHWDGSSKEATKTGLQYDTWYLVAYWIDASVGASPVQIEVNGSAGTPSAAANANAGTSTFIVGVNYSTSDGHKGPILEIGALPDYNPTPTERTKLLKYARQRYGLPLT